MQKKQFKNKMNKKNIIYLPWSSSNLQSIKEGYIKRKMPFLYLELSAKCSKCNCLYCDSPVHNELQNELSFDEIKNIINKFEEKGLIWLFICGYGEPSEDEKLMPLLSYLKNKNIKVSLFTNGLGFSVDDIELLKKNSANLILKLDTFKKDIFDKLLGSKGVAEKIYSFLDSLLLQGFVKLNSNNETNLAFSIVPTALNIDLIPEVIKFCANNSIYPAIGEMEPIGNAIKNMSLLTISANDLQNLNKKISNILGYDYYRPLCPGIIADYRIDHTGNCIIDSATGLGCGWFLDEKHDPLIIGNIRNDTIDSIQEKAFLFRNRKFKQAINILKSKKTVISCGGGSRPTDWVDGYINLMNECIKNNTEIKYLM